MSEEQSVEVESATPQQPPEADSTHVVIDRGQATVERRHRLAVLRAHGFAEATTLERTSHYAYHWLERGVQPAHHSTWDRLAQEIANAEALGREDRDAYQRGLRQILDRIDRAIADELRAP